ncbi:MAG: hypothetical protein QOF70_3442, partial [Acetobacteraceae bacterium]|nr:hypothetical protein [Acetobacteraceae bacterium]
MNINTWEGCLSRVYTGNHIGGEHSPEPEIGHRPLTR